jgi:hypothetical protein
LRRISSITVIFFILSTVVYSISLSQLRDIQLIRKMSQWNILGEVPLPVLKASSLEFSGVSADFLLLETLAFLGESSEEKRILTDAEFQYLHRQFERITALDPRFWDAYLLAESILAWDAGMYTEVNALLEKAAQARPEDYRPNYFIGFNYFFFLKNPKKAAQYLRKAAGLPGAPEFLQGLASRMSIYGNETKLALVFLSDILKTTKNPATRKYLEKRLRTLEIIYGLEQKVAEFKRSKGSYPQRFDEIIEAGLLDDVPEDPYGGEFYLLENGRIYTTSNMIEVEKKSQ